MDGFFKVGVDDDIVIFAVVGNFVGGFLHSVLNDRFIVLLTGAEAPFQFFLRGRKNKNSYKVIDQFLFELLGSLPIDVKNNVLGICKGLFNRLEGGSVIITKNFCVFKQLVIVNHRGELLFADKMVIFAVYFPRAGGAGGYRD